MAKLKNPLFLLSGTLGDMVFRRGRNGSVIVACRPRRRASLTPHQQRVSSAFTRAANYARAQMLDPVAKAECASRRTNRKTSAYTVALTDYLNDPSVRQIDISRYHGDKNDIIAINPTNDSDVVSVHVTITWKGMFLECGEAEAKGPHDTIGSWHYITTTNVWPPHGTKITATLRDTTGKSSRIHKTLQPS